MATSAYVHIPFCRRRCGYCNFSLVADRDYLVDRFLNALATEIERLDASYELATLYLGGGTPSHLSGPQLRRLREIIARRFQLHPAVEFTAECNPEDMGQAKVDALAEIGVNRISMGVQSFQADKLKLLEREHDPHSVASAVRRCRAAFASLSLDLIFALENETLADWRDDLEQAIQLSPEHISAYELTYEKGTAFWIRRARGELQESVDDLKAEMYELAIDVLVRAGWEHYEVSSFAKDGHRSRHNRVYWQGTDYFAFGPSASSYLKGVRATNHRSTTTYLKRLEAGESPIGDKECLSLRGRAIEHLVIGLRMREGIDVAEFKRQNKWDPLDLIASVGQELKSLELIETTATRIRLTHKGLMVYDWVATRLLSDEYLLGSH